MLPPCKAYRQAAARGLQIVAKSPIGTDLAAFTWLLRHPLVSRQSYRKPQTQDSFPSALLFEVSRSCLKQVIQRNHAEQIARLLPIDDRHAGQTCLRHPVDHDP